MPAGSVLFFARYAVFALVALAAFVALASWLVRRRYVSPFSALGRGLRSTTDAILSPVERRLVKMGGNPVHAGGWLIVLTAVAGIVLLSLLGWVLTTFQSVQMAAGSGPRATLALIIRLAYRILVFALLVRIVGSWFGVSRYTAWIRPAYILTDWIVEPMRRIVPPLGPFDITPLAAWFGLFLIQQVLLAMLRALP
jgi:YggT family protein